MFLDLVPSAGVRVAVFEAWLIGFLLGELCVIVTRFFFMFTPWRGLRAPLFLGWGFSETYTFPAALAVEVFLPLVVAVCNISAWPSWEFSSRGLPILSPASKWALSELRDLIGETCRRERRSLAGGLEEDGFPEVFKICMGNVSSMYCTSTS